MRSMGCCDEALAMDPRTVLVVEDDPDSRKALVMILRSAGYQP